MQRILPVLVLLGVLVLGVLAAKVLFRNPEVNPPSEDVAEISGEEKRGDLPPAGETRSEANQEAEGYEAPSGTTKSEISKATPSFKQSSPATEVERTETVKSGSRRETARMRSVARSPEGPSTLSQNKSEARDQAPEENQQSRLIISPEEQRELMRLYIEALTHLRE